MLSGVPGGTRLPCDARAERRTRRRNARGDIIFGVENMPAGSILMQCERKHFPPYAMLFLLKKNKPSRQHIVYSVDKLRRIGRSV